MEKEERGESHQITLKKCFIWQMYTKRYCFLCVINVSVSASDGGLYLHIEHGSEIGFQVVTRRVARLV